MWSRLLPSRNVVLIGVRSLLWYTPFRHYMYYRYTYSFTPEQLAFFVGCLNDTREVDGDIFEIGCAAGQTTCFLNRHLQQSNIAKDYYCIDTFHGFTSEDVNFEVSQRGKKGSDFTGFRVNQLKWFMYTLKQNRCDRVFCVRTDVQRYKFCRPISFCLLDVDLYRPTLYALKHIWPLLSPGGIIVVDDCRPANEFDGALQAYTEFTESQKIPARFVMDKLGLIQKGSPS